MSGLPGAGSGAERPRARRIARALWPAPLVLLALSGAAALRFDLDFEPLGVGWFLLVWVLPYALAIAFVGYAVGGRRGPAVSAALLALVVWWAYTFGWDFSSSGPGVTTAQIAVALGDAGAYHLGLLLTLWPLALAVVIVTTAASLARGRRLWPTFGLLALGVTFVAAPTGAGWDDGCNGRYGAAPLLVKPTAGALMDHGIEVIPSGASTAMDCGFGDREFKPFWQGDDGLPPAPQLYGTSLPPELTIPAALPSADDAWLRDGILRVALLREPDTGFLNGLVRNARPLHPEDGWTVRIDGVPADAVQPFPPRNRSGSCSTVFWSGQRLRRYRGPAGPVDWAVYRSPSDRPRVLVTVERDGRVLASRRLELRANDGRDRTRKAFRTAFSCNPSG